MTFDCLINPSKELDAVCLRFPAEDALCQSCSFQGRIYCLGSFIWHSIGVVAKPTIAFICAAVLLVFSPLLIVGAGFSALCCNKAGVFCELTNTIAFSIVKFSLIAAISPFTQTLQAIKALAGAVFHPGVYYESTSSICHDDQTTNKELANTFSLEILKKNDISTFEIKSELGDALRQLGWAQVKGLLFTTIGGEKRQFDLQKAIKGMLADSYNPLSGIYQQSVGGEIILCRSPEDLSALLLIAKLVGLKEEARIMENMRKQMGELVQFYLEEFNFTPELLDTLSYTTTVLQYWAFFERTTDKEITFVRARALLQAYDCLKKVCCRKDGKWKKQLEITYNFPPTDALERISNKLEELNLKTFIQYSTPYWHTIKEITFNLKDTFESALEPNGMCLTDVVAHRLKALFPSGMYLVTAKGDGRHSVERTKLLKSLQESESYSKFLNEDPNNK